MNYEEIKKQIAELLSSTVSHLEFASQLEYIPDADRESLKNDAGEFGKYLETLREVEVANNNPNLDNKGNNIVEKRVIADMENELISTGIKDHFKDCVINFKKIELNDTIRGKLEGFTEKWEKFCEPKNYDAFLTKIENKIYDELFGTTSSEFFKSSYNTIVQKVEDLKTSLDLVDENTVEKYMAMKAEIARCTEEYKSVISYDETDSCLRIMFINEKNEIEPEMGRTQMSFTILDPDKLKQIENKINTPSLPNGQEQDIPEEPAIEPAPAKEPDKEPAKGPDKEPEEPAIEQVIEPAKGPDKEPDKEPAIEPVIEPAKGPDKEPEEPAIEPVIEPAKEPDKEPAKEPAKETGSGIKLKTRTLNLDKKKIPKVNRNNNRLLTVQEIEYKIINNRLKIEKLEKVKEILTGLKLKKAKISLVNKDNYRMRTSAEFDKNTDSITFGFADNRINEDNIDKYKIEIRIPHGKRTVAIYSESLEEAIDKTNEEPTEVQGRSR